MIRNIRMIELEMKMALKCMIRALLLLLTLIVIMSTILFAFNSIFQAKSENAVLKIGVVTDEDNSFGMLVRFANSISSLQGICRLEIFNRQEALDELQKGNLALVMDIPDEFVDKAQHMEETSFDIYTPKNITTSQKRILRLLVGVEDVMVTTESAIQSCYDSMEQYTFTVDRATMESDLTMLYVMQFLNRDDYFETEYLSLHGAHSSVQYYCLAVLLCAMLLAAVCYMKMYDDENVMIEKMLAPSVSQRCFLTITKTLTVALVGCLPVWILIIGCRCVNRYARELDALNIVESVAGINMFTVLLVSCGIVGMLGVCALYIDGRGKRVLIYILISLLMIVASGIMSSVYFLPPLMRGMAGIWPVGIWQGALLDSLEGGITLKTFVYLIAVIFILFIIRLIGCKKRELI